MMAVRSHPGIILRQLLPDAPVPAELADTAVQGLALDSRKVAPGYLFLAIPGTATDGRGFINQALEQGAVAVVAEAEGLDIAAPRVVPVPGLAAKVGAIAACFYAEPSRQLAVTGITGTNGKTTCCQLLGQLFSRLGEAAGVIGTLGTGVYRDGRVALRDLGMTTPDPVAVQAQLAEFAAGQATSVAMEVSSHSLDQDRVNAVLFETAVFTNLSRDHLDYHGSLENYAAAKLKLFRQPGLKYAIVNGDDPLASQIAASLDRAASYYTYAIDAQADVRATGVEILATGIKARVATPWGDGVLASRLLGRFNLANLLAVLATACVRGFALSDVLAALADLWPVSGRMEVVGARSDGAPAVIVDYAHTPDALETTLQSLREHCQGRLWCVFGCGGDRDRGKRRMMGEVAAAGADQVIVTSDNPRSEEPNSIIRDIAAGAPGAAALPDRAEAIDHAVAMAKAGDTVLIAGKGHEDCQEIAGVKYPFSDREQVLAALAARQGETGGSHG